MTLEPDMSMEELADMINRLQEELDNVKPATRSISVNA